MTFYVSENYDLSWSSFLGWLKLFSNSRSDGSLPYFLHIKCSKARDDGPACGWWWCRKAKSQDKICFQFITELVNFFISLSCLTLFFRCSNLSQPIIIIITAAVTVRSDQILMRFVEVSCRFKRERARGEKKSRIFGDNWPIKTHNNTSWCEESSLSLHLKPQIFL